MLERFVVHFLACTFVLPLCGCAPTAGDLVSQLEDCDPFWRIRAIVKVANSERFELMPQLVDRLEDEDSAVRFYAIFALEELTGTRLGYSYAAPVSERRKTVQAWRELTDDWFGMGLGSNAAFH